MGIKSDIEYAIYSHGAWKARFRSFLSGKAGLDLSAIGHTESCKLGKWLADEARRMLSPEDHVKACELHAHFHRVAGDIVHNIKQKNFSAARQALGPAGAFDQASHEMGAFLRTLARRSRPKPANKTTEDGAVAEPAGTPQASG
jgi:methyl-accepting chemotaxis protein